MHYVEVSDGDSLDWVKLEFEAFHDDGKKIRALLDLTIDKSARNYDFRSKLWFVRVDVVDALLAGINTMIKRGVFSGLWEIKDSRTKIEPIEDFFYNTPPPTTSIAFTRAQLLEQFSKLLNENGLSLAGVKQDPTKEDLKSVYRKAAMAFHPDRNKGDESRMTELNRIWSEL